MPVGKPFERGKSPNPGGRPNIAKLLEGFGRSADSVRKKMVEQALTIVEAGPKSTNDACWRYAHDWLAAHVGLRPHKDVDVHIHDGEAADELDIDGLTGDELDALERALRQRLGLEAADGDAPTVQ